MLEGENDLVKVVPDGVLCNLPACSFAFPNEVGKISSATVLHDEIDDASLRVKDLRRRNKNRCN